MRRITELRLQRGVNAVAAIPARSTVYNAFRTGRARMDTELVRDIVIALGVEPQDAEAWVRRCRDARGAAEASVKPEIGEATETSASRPSLSLARIASEPKLSPSLVVLFLAACVALNLLGLFTANTFKLSVYLDMVGTAIAAIVLGPWHGVAVAIGSNGLGFLTGDLHTLEFVPVNIMGALVWGYGVRKFRMGAGLTRYVSLNLLTALTCSLVAAPLVVAMFHGGDGHASEQAVLSLEAMRVPFVASVFSANLVTSILDKLLTGFIALAVFTFLHGKTGIHAGHMPLVEKVGTLRSAPAPCPPRLSG